MLLIAAMTEPITTLTDYAISLFALIFAGVLLHQSWRQRQVSISLWAMAFGFVALAAGLGGTCHGFVSILGQPLIQRFWTGMLYALTLASLALLWGTLLSTLAPPWQRWGLLAALAKASLIWCILPALPLTASRFTPVAWDYGSGLGVALLLYGGVYLTQSRQSRAAKTAGWMVAGIIISAVAIGVLGSRMTVGSLTAADLYHLIQLAGLALLFQGTRQLRDQ